MATNATSPPKVQRNLKGFTTVLKSAACEWCLIFLLFIDAALSYLLTRFAQYCELQIPCILCSRLDHVFGNEKLGFYRTLLCRNHRSEISSLLSCNIHGKLVEGRGMCENCLSSHVEANKSNSDMQRLFLGKLGYDPAAGFGNCGSQSSFFNRDLTPASKFTRLCLCCNKPWIPRSNPHRLLTLKSPGIAVAKPNIPLSRGLSRLNDLKKKRDKFSAPAASHLLGKTGFDPLSHVGYNELKITSESESEFPFSDDEDGSNTIVRDINENKKESVVHSAPETPPKRLYNNLATIKQPDANESRDVRCLAPDLDVCEHKEQLADQKANSSLLPQLISLDDIPPSSCVMEVPSFSASLLSDLISLVDTPPSVNVKEVPLEASSEILADVFEANKSENISINKNDELSKLIISTSTGAGFKTDRVLDDTAMVNSINGDPSAVHKLSVSIEEKSPSEFVAKQPMVTYNNGVNEDHKLSVLPVQNSSGQGIHLSLNNLSPKLRGRGVEFQRTNESNSDEVQNLQNLVFTERSESAGLKSLDGSSVNEIEGENLVDKLKQQVEYDRKCMNALYKELEEERSASAIAANQAMAMITRLQEEKAGLRMEALQYLRMMEEQAEYDVDALEKANDLLAEKEKELQDLEAELEYYRLNFPDETLVETVPDTSINLKKEHVSVENTSTSSKKDGLKFPSKTMFPEASEVNDNPVVISAWPEVEDEKLYISQCLQNLERKLNRLALYGTSPYISDSEYFDEAADGGQYQLEFIEEKDKQVTCQVEANDLSVQKVSSMSNGTAPSQKRLSTSISRDQAISKANGHMVSNRQKGCLDCKETGLVALENEISDLNERLEALEVDCSFLEHSLNSLQNGNEGLLFIQEILHQLRELRKLGLRTRNVSVS